MIVKPTNLYPGGVSTVPEADCLGLLPHPSPFVLSEFGHGSYGDFHVYTAAHWTITTTTGSTALVAENGGWVRLTTAASANDIQHNAKATATFQINAGFRFFFAIRVRGANVTDPAFIFGMQAGGTAFAPTDGIFFRKAAAAATVNLEIRNGGTSTTIANVATLVNNTAMSLGFLYTGDAVTPEVSVFTSSGLTQSFGNDFISPGGKRVGGTATLTNLPTPVISPAFGVQAESGAARTLDVDYVYCGQYVNRV